jgi:ribonuclease H / adenosylcobalamin/alpha-ribazole phosphatase
MGSLVLARHATTAASAAGRNLGRGDDPPLAPQGRELAARLGRAVGAEIEDLLAGGPPELRRVSSSARRCRETIDAILAAVAGGGNAAPPALEPHDGLLELDYGAWDGLTPDECRKRDPDLRAAWESDPYATRAPGGESGRDVADRSFPIFEELEAWLAGGDRRIAVVVAHNHVNRLRLCRLIGWPLREYRDRVVQDPGGYNLITFPRAGRPPVVRRVNALPLPFADKRSAGA